MNFLYNFGYPNLQQMNQSQAILLIVLIVWSLIWKGLALWRAARNGSLAWFVVLLVVNTLGILEILYLYIFSKKGPEAQKIASPENNSAA